MKYYSVKKLASITGLTERAIRKRAQAESWEYREIKNRKEYEYDSIAPEYQAKIIARQQVKTHVKEDINIKDIKKKNLKYAESRLYILASFKHDYQLSVEEFAILYNMNKISIPGYVKDIYPEISAGTLYRWMKESPEMEIEKLAANYKGKEGFGARSLTAEQSAVLVGIYLQFKAFKMAKTYRVFQETCGISVSYSTIRRTLSSIPIAIRCLFKEGKRKYNDKFAPYLKMNYDNYEVMEYWDSDHHKIDAFVIDKEGHIFRPWLTVYQDVKSRKITGWHIGQYASSWTISLAFKMAFIQFGAPRILKIDNGKDYKSKKLQGYMVRLSDGECVRIEGLFKKFGIQVQFATPYHGQAKPVESWFRTVINDWTVTLPTYTGSNTVSTVKDRDLLYKEVKSKVKLTLEELSASFESWVTKWNATWKHTGDGMYGRTPDEVFNEGMKNVIKLEINEEYLNYMFSEDISVTCRRNGLTINKLEYYDPALALHKGSKVIAKKDMFDISKVAVFSLDGEYICDAYNERLRDSGVTEENLKNIKRSRKKEIKLIKEFKEQILEKGNISFENEIILDAQKNKNKKPGKQEVIRERKSLFM
ncbi:MAG: transposase [Spirochaetes bacterium]|nr:transposase [Spirochaetota bacterium]